MEEIERVLFRLSVAILARGAAEDVLHTDVVRGSPFE
jgi:hypothetical protein